MANWAIVIGIDKYWTPKINLRSAVKDSLSMREWLIRSDGGAVPPNNLFLLLEPTGSSPSPPDGVEVRPATLGAVVQATVDLFSRSREEGERFFFYFAGHGVTSRMDFTNESGLVLSDFTSTLTTNSLTLRSLFERFQAARFQEQFFIIDACRDIPWDHEYRLGEYPKPVKPTPPVPPQFVMYATSPGLKAVEVSEHGAFTGALLEALKGHQSAKVWDDQAQEYLLRWDSIFKWVEAEITRKKYEVQGELIQVPRQGGERGSHNPELGRFPAGAFAKETLDVNLDPDSVAPQAEVVVGDLSGEIARASAITSLPVNFQLEPRTYSVRAAAPNYQMERRFYPIDLYHPASVTVKLEPAEAATRGLEAAPRLTRGFGDEPVAGTIDVRSPDPLAQVELADNTGQIIARGEGYVYRTDLQPGFYRARLVTPEGTQAEQLVELLPGEQESVSLQAPAPPDSDLFRELIGRADLQVESGNLIYPSEAVGPVATAQATTLLALAGGAVNEDTDTGQRLRRIGISSFRKLAGLDARQGIQILFGVEADTPDEALDYLYDVKLRVWGQSQPISEAVDHPSRLAESSGLAEFAWDREPGPHWLAIQAPGERPVAVAVTVLPNRLALVVFHRDREGAVDIYQYLPSLIAADPNDPRRDYARFPVLQRSELIQRSYMGGRLEEPQQNALELLYAKWVEPIAGCLGGYILLKVNPAHDLLDIATENMTMQYGELSDSHVLQASHLANQGKDDLAEEAFRAALDRGLPVISDGLVLLRDGIRRYNLEHPGVGFVEAVYQSRVRGLLWTGAPVTQDTEQIFSA